MTSHELTTSAFVAKFRPRTKLKAEYALEFKDNIRREDYEEIRTQVNELVVGNFYCERTALWFTDVNDKLMAKLAMSERFKLD